MRQAHIRTSAHRLPLADKKLLLIHSPIVADWHGKMLIKGLCEVLSYDLTFCAAPNNKKADWLFGQFNWDDSVGQSPTNPINRQIPMIDWVTPPESDQKMKSKVLLIWISGCLSARLTTFNYLTSREKNVFRNGSRKCCNYTEGQS